MFTTRIRIIYYSIFSPPNMTKVIAAAIGALPAQRSMERDHAKGADPNAVAMRRRKRKEEQKTRSLLRTRMPMSPRKKKTKSSGRAATFAQPPKSNVTAKNPVARTVRREGKLQYHLMRPSIPPIIEILLYFFPSRTPCHYSERKRPGPKINPGMPPATLSQQGAGCSPSPPPTRWPEHEHNRFVHDRYILFPLISLPPLIK